MRGPPPKPEGLRQRRNKVPGAAQLQTAESALENEVPPLPVRGYETGVNSESSEPKEIPWHPNVIEWWDSVWKSPMASEYLDADMKGGLYLLAELYQARWEGTAEITKVAAEIRQQEIRFGLSPIDRNRLRWEVEKGENAAQRTEARREAKRPSVPKGKDPRSILKMA